MEVRQPSGNFLCDHLCCLDDASTFKPGAVFYTARGYGWDFLDPEVPRVAGWRAGAN